MRELNQWARWQAQAQGLVLSQEAYFQAQRGVRVFAPGDPVVFLRNHAGLDVKNGGVGTVVEAQFNFLQIKLSTGRRLSLEADQYAHVDHGYALTVHQAQGVTVDRAHVVVSDLANREWMYVAASRAREETHLYAEKSQQKAMEAQLSRSVQKDTSLDYSLMR